MRRAAAAALALLLLASAVTTAQSPDRYTRRSIYIRGLVNGTRLSHGLSGLTMDARLAACAQAHAERMARQGETFHSKGCEGRARSEIVGMGPSPNRIHRAFWRSQPHRGALLCRCSRVGPGVVLDNGTYYVVVQFR